MINVNGNIIPEEEANLSVANRGFLYGDAVFETLKYVHGKILFWEDHYFRLMSSMRILRMEIPMNFTLEFLEDEMRRLIQSNGLSEETARIKLMVNRKSGGLYNPKNNDVEFLITLEQLSKSLFEFETENYTVDLFKDYMIAPGLLSNLKTNNRVINVVGSIYAKENNLDNCLLLNTNKGVIEALNGNIFLVYGRRVKTPPLADGCLKGVMRKQIIDIITEMDDLELEEASISPFELKKATELFISNVIWGIKPINKYRKKVFTTDVSKQLLKKLNTLIEN